MVCLSLHIPNVRITPKTYKQLLWYSYCSRPANGNECVQCCDEEAPGPFWQETGEGALEGPLWARSTPHSTAQVLQAWSVGCGLLPESRGQCRASSPRGLLLHFLPQPIFHPFRLHHPESKARGPLPRTAAAFLLSDSAD